MNKKFLCETSYLDSSDNYQVYDFDFICEIIPSNRYQNFAIISIVDMENSENVLAYEILQLSPFLTMEQNIELFWDTGEILEKNYNLIFCKVKEI